jgi:alkylation response protein AidB-like acyl-CoA dehydrogenase
MDMEFTAEDLAFRDEVRAFISENYPQELRGKQDEGDELGKEDFLAWHRILTRRAGSRPAWPVEYGGTGWTADAALHLVEETARADCIRLMPFGLSMVGPVIYTFGTPEQKAKFLAPHSFG